MIFQKHCLLALGNAIALRSTDFQIPDAVRTPHDQYESTLEDARASGNGP
jgi:hypothetical protein